MVRYSVRKKDVVIDNFLCIIIDSGEEITSKLTDLTLRSKETSITTLLNSTAGKIIV